MLGYPKAEEEQPHFPHLLPQGGSGGMRGRRCSWRGGGRGLLYWGLVSGGARSWVGCRTWRKAPPPPPICHGPAAVAPPECEALASTPPLQPNPLGQVGVKGAGGGGVLMLCPPPPPMTTASQGGQGTLAGPAFPGSLSAICARVVKGVN